MTVRSKWADPVWLKAFETEFGRLPTFMDLLMMQEAEASVALSEHPDGQTMRERVDNDEI